MIGVESLFFSLRSKTGDSTRQNFRCAQKQETPHDKISGICEGVEIILIKIKSEVFSQEMNDS